jgi:hypothetical protein
MAMDGGGQRSAVSTAGGFDPKWNRSGGELYYLAPTGWLMAARVHPNGPTITDDAQPLFHAVEPNQRMPFTSVFDVAPDGSRFLVRVPLEDVRTLPLKVLLDWGGRPGR